ncbi:MAG TPA: hypothetical protein VEK13_01680 [Thermoplasmata archaeon]|nr:hypothetical protein [Thermoplasmata archaeon]
MTTLRPTSFLLFAAGEPDRGDDGRAIASQLTVPTILHSPRVSSGSSTGPPSEELLWHFPVEQRACVRLVTDIAKSMGQVVTVIDVNWPEGDRDLVERWMGPNSLLPMLIAPDGRRLEGIESFVPSRVRRFLAKAGPSGAEPLPSNRARRSDR